ncbi:hypothetical protein B7G68_09150 [Caulobacter segnis]|uniref:Alpha-L-rhamnosidase n=2 Tax=Caulobacter segnis TaxID=88688 RepID=D5VGD9_CAUST|nr:alpha-L-rhamnosidase C-terminal domain-containing protein [Caulobacter segnis]ADG10258.1 alpha-L-rhamnosidase [Caulobacter segnis ATCC 21756]AVQ01997.1 hypothetical protein B7G68_09150 [Caulobacter segnis]
MVKAYRPSLVLVLALAFGPAASAEPIWITHPAAPSAPTVVRFERDLTLARKPGHFPVRVSADNRFILLVNGRRVGAGPATSDLGHWRYATLDLAPYLTRGSNHLEAVVWNYVKPEEPIPDGLSPAQKNAAAFRNQRNQTGPVAQISARLGFWFSAPGAPELDSGPTWRVQLDSARSAAPVMGQVAGFYAAGPSEIVDARVPLAAPVAATPALAPGEPSPWALSADPLPQMSYRAVDPGLVARTNLDEAKAFPRQPVTIPARKTVKILLARPAMVAAYPTLRVTGGKDASIKLTYAEALIDAKGRKGLRSEVGDRTIRGLSDRFTADGGARAFAPLWWRTWRYLEIEVQTADQPLRLQGLDVAETDYPFGQVGKFVSDDPELNRIWDIGWRTARIDAHETYMDTAYYEQLQYVGDTRLQALISYAVSGDPRLATQAMDAFGASRALGGVTEGAYPSRTSNPIPPFSLLWIGMLHDYWSRHPDPEPARRHLARAREVLAWFDGYLGPDGLMRKTPGWSFVDWAVKDGRLLSRDAFPSYDAQGRSCLLSLAYLGALRDMTDLEAALGEPSLAGRDRSRAEAIAAAVRDQCWAPDRGLFADTPDKASFSQHTNALAVLYDVAAPKDAAAILDRTVGQAGIDAPTGMISTSYYYAWYLVRAFDHAGQADRYLSLLDTWRGLLALDYTTWPEERGNTRSDTHAWSAHPTADLLELVAGIRPDAPGYGRLRVEPHLGALRRLDAAAATPQGPVEVKYRRKGQRLVVEVRKPAGLSGVFVWRGQSHALLGARTRLDLPAGD